MPQVTKNIAVLTAFPPSRDNQDWPSALPYHLLLHAPQGAAIHLFYFRGDPKYRTNWEEGFKALPLASVTEFTPFMGRRERWCYQLKNLGRPKVPPQVDWFPVRGKDVRAIQAVRPEAVWVYPHWLTPWVRALGIAHTVVTGPDSGVLHHERALLALAPRAAGDSEAAAELERSRQARGEYEALERILLGTGAQVHAVGAQDAARYDTLARDGRVAAAKPAIFTPHPHYHFLPVAQRLDRQNRKLQVFVSGHAGAVYIGDHGTRMVRGLVAQAAALRDHIALEFVGKQWEKSVAALTQAGFEVQQHTWVNDYPSALASADIALGLYAVGVGTKGKVLQAMATGLLTLGSALAFENIAAQAGTDYVLYQQPEEIGELLLRVLADRSGHAQIAAQGAAAVRKNHSPAVTAQAFWRLFQW
ncbi:MAG: glycosyltransferase [Phycisphaerae bacterium]